MSANLARLQGRLLRVLVVCLTITVVSLILLATMPLPPSDSAQPYRKQTLAADRPPSGSNDNHSPIEAQRLADDVTNTSTLFRRWRQYGQASCGGRFVNFATFALLTGAVLDRERCRGAAALGGESLVTVLGQNESSEYFTNFDGCFALPCHSGDLHRGIITNPLSQWLAGLETDVTVLDRASRVERSFTVALTRFDYANMYFVVNDWYNVFLIARFFDQRPEKTRVLLIDAHPRGAFDDSWSKLFGGTRSASLQLSRVLPGRTLFTGSLVWGLTGPGPLSKPTSYRERAPLIDEFHRFVVKRHGLMDPDERKLNCSNVSVLFVWRRDYIAHPRNPSGTVQRKISNEEELIRSISERHRDTYSVRGIQLDLLPVADQLRVVGKSDVLIGMHGAGLSHVLFMPRHGALVELETRRARGENTHFADLALWRGLVYRRWKNGDRNNEISNEMIRIPVNVVDALLGSTVATMCSNSTSSRRTTAFEYHEALRRRRLAGRKMRS